MMYGCKLVACIKFVFDILECVVYEVVDKTPADRNVTYYADCCSVLIMLFQVRHWIAHVSIVRWPVLGDCS